MAEQITLLRSWISPFSKRVEMALKLKGVEYEFIEEDLSNKSDLLLQSNPLHKKVPVLLHGGKPICESLIILEYIDEVHHGFQLLSNDPRERAHARLVAKFIDEKCIPSFWPVIRSKGEEREKARAEFCEYLRVLEKELEGKKFFGGEKVGFVDIAANFFAYWLLILQEVMGDHCMNPNEFPLLCNWGRAFVSLEVVKSCLPEKDRMLACAKIDFGL